MNDTKKIWPVMLLMITFIAACRKEEFIPDPQGEQVPYVQTDSTLQQMLARPEYNLFNKAWRKSGMNDLLAGWGNKAQFTLLVPDDAAMQAAGLDDAGIAGTAKEVLDSMLMLHTVIGYVDGKTFGSHTGSVGLRTMLVNPVFIEALNAPGTAVTRDSVYRYQQYLALNKEQQLLISGRVAGSASPVTAKNGAIWKINRVLQPARKNMREALEGDARFTLYLEAMRLADSLYETVGLDALSIAPFMFYTTTFNTSVPEIDWDCFCNKLIYGKTERNSLFAPTNEAFAKAGLHTVDDIRALNSRSKPVYENYIMIGHGVLDSLLSINTWGRQRSLFVFYIPPVFYSNDLVPEIMKDFHLKTTDIYGPPVVLPLEFSKDAGGRTQVQWKGSNAEKATIIEPPIETVQGPIHVIDRLIVQPGFHF